MTLKSWMQVNMLTKCPNCQKYRLFVRRRKFFAKNLNLWLTSTNRLCGTCGSIYKRVQ